MISVRQIDQSSLVAAIQQVTTGAAFASNLQGYVNAGGTLGPNVMYVSGLNQTVSGVKTFASSPGVPYSGGTGTAPSRKYVDDANLNTSGALAGQFVSSTLAQSVQGTKTFDVPVIVALPTATGHATNLLFIQRVSGALTGQAGGGISPTFSGYVESYFVHRLGTEAITGQKTFATEVLVPTPDGSNSSQAVNVTYLNTVSGVIIGQAGGGNVGAFNPVYTSGNQVISGFKLFTGSPWVANPTANSGAANLFYVTGISGGLYQQMLNISGSLTGTIVVNTGGGVFNTTITGNFNIASFFLDPVITGLNLAESFVGGMGYYFTGAAFACRTSGSAPVNGGIMSGKLYQVDFNNTEQTLYTFTYTSGIIYSGSPGFNVYVTGGNRVGLTLTNSLSGIQKMSIGIFGGNYA